MHHYFPIPLLIFCFGFATLQGAEELKNPTSNKIVRIKKLANKDTIELKLLDKMIVSRRVLRPDKQGKPVLLSTSDYILDKKHRQRVCKIKDAKGKEILKVRFGYSRTSGFLIVESIYDMENIKRDKNGAQLSAQRFYYKYDAYKNRSKPFTLNKKGGELPTKWIPRIEQKLIKLGIPHAPSLYLPEKDIESVLPQTMK